MQEARAASSLNHSGIITIYDIDTAEGETFIAMELVEGKTLAQLIRRKGLPLNETLKYAVQIAGALAAAHAAGIVHRDLKPANVMVNEKGIVKVLDFGLAKLAQTDQDSEFNTTQTVAPLTEEGTIVGTVSYMSPEEGRCAFGCLFFRLAAVRDDYGTAGVSERDEDIDTFCDSTRRTEADNSGHGGPAA